MPVYALRYFLVALLSYCLGNLNGAILVSKTLYHSDVRESGSKNGGLTNFLRVYGKKAAPLVILIDAGKAVASAFLGGVILQDTLGAEVGQGLALLFVVLGHMFPALYHFRGGKGVLAGVSALFVLDWRIGLILLCVFALVLFATRYVSLGSILCGMSLPFLVHFFIGIPVVTIECAVACFLLVFMHRSNISRLLHGCENKFSL